MNGAGQLSIAVTTFSTQDETKSRVD